MATTFTIADIVKDPSLDTRVLSGADGLGRAVLWAHSCEMADPGRWLGPHELLMTIGLCIPEDAAGQRQLIARLDDAGLAGMAIGDDGVAPALSDAMLAEADERGFPILRTGHDTPFAAIGRTVAASNSDRQTMGVLLLAKLYQIAGRRDSASRRTGADLSDLFGTALTVIDDATGCVLIGDSERMASAAGTRTHALRTHRASHLIVEADAQLDSFSLVHLTQILAADANIIAQDAFAAIREGAALLEQALSGTRSESEALAVVWKAGRPGYRVVVTTCGTHDLVPLAMSLAGVPPTILQSHDSVTLALPSDDIGAARLVLERLGLTAGVSAEHHDLADLPGAVAEAASEHAMARTAQERWRVFEGEHVSLLARSKTEAAQIITTVLGPLAATDLRSEALRHTLFVLLDNDLRWNDTARALALHRQSLVYRLNQVEKLTGRSVRRTQDLSEFWLARSAWRLLHDAR